MSIGGWDEGTLQRFIEELWQQSTGAALTRQMLGACLLARRIPAGANYTTNTGVVNAIDTTNLSAKVLTSGRPLRVGLEFGNLSIAAAGNIGFDLYLDGAFAGRRYRTPPAGNAESGEVVVTLPAGAAPAGSHTIEWRWFVTASTATLVRDTTHVVNFTIVELQGPVNA